eukprot:scaffold258260_cov35-Tisochrysis_lutea.AAC.2
MLGENGTGKTTFIKMLAGMLPADGETASQVIKIASVRYALSLQPTRPQPLPCAGPKAQCFIQTSKNRTDIRGNCAHAPPQEDPRSLYSPAGNVVREASQPISTL